jgi:hypothetical protein
VPTVTDAEAALAALIERVKAATVVGLDDAGSVVERSAKRHASGRPGPMVRTGTLRRSIRRDPVVYLGSGLWRIHVAPHTVYARLQELGGHIYPHEGHKWLHWVDEQGSHYRKHVYVPARPYLAPAVQDSKVEVRDTMRNHWAAAVRG